MPQRFVPAGYDANKLRVLQEVFDETWAQIGSEYPAETAEEARTALAKALVAAASEGISDIDQLRARALEALRRPHR